MLQNHVNSLRIRVDFFTANGKITKIVLAKGIQKGFSWTIQSTELEASVANWMEGYRTQAILGTELPLAPLLVTPFTKKVWAAIAAIPFGETRSYSEIAKSIGHPKAVRAVGTACGKNPYPLVVACHRVIACDGSLGGFAFDLTIKRALLEFERKTSCSETKL